MKVNEGGDGIAMKIVNWGATAQMPQSVASSLVNEDGGAKKGLRDTTRGPLNVGPGQDVPRRSFYCQRVLAE